MFLSKLIKSFVFPLLFIIVILFFEILKQKLTFIQSTSHQKENCSFDHISVCQMRNVTNRTFLYIIWGRAGFSSELNQLLLAFAYSVSTKREFLVDSRQWNYGSFNDYFDFPSINNSSQLNRTFLIENNSQNDQIQHLKTTRIGSQVRTFWLSTRHLQSIEIKRRVAHYLWKTLTKETLKFIQTCKIQNLSNYIGIHIRKGDKLMKESQLQSLNKYINQIQQIRTINNKIRDIFVASDDLFVIKELIKLKPKWNFLPIHNNNRTEKSGHFQANFNRLTSKDKLFETRLFLCELEMLINSEYLLCTMSSNVCRLLQILRYQNTSTVISLDRPWYGT